MYDFRKAELTRFQSQMFVIAIGIGEKTYKVLQISFAKSDGSLFVSFPYFRLKEGLICRANFPVAPSGNQKVDLTDGGKLTQNPVKYVHHTSGDAHFSLSGKVMTSIRKKSIPLATSEGHIFSFHCQGLEYFDETSAKDRLKPNLKRTVLTFNITEADRKAYKLVGRWYTPSKIIRMSGAINFGPFGYFQSDNGAILQGVLLGQPSGWKLDDHILALTLERIDPLGDGAMQLFVGAFNSPFEPIGLSTSFLCAQYPVTNYEQVLTQIGSVDLPLNNDT